MGTRGRRLEVAELPGGDQRCSHKERRRVRGEAASRPSRMPPEGLGANEAIELPRQEKEASRMKGRTPMVVNPSFANLGYRALSSAGTIDFDRYVSVLWSQVHLARQIGAAMVDDVDLRVNRIWLTTALILGEDLRGRRPMHLPAIEPSMEIAGHSQCWPFSLTSIVVFGHHTTLLDYTHLLADPHTTLLFAHGAA
jgi:hypothetical protein